MSSRAVRVSDLCTFGVRQDNLIPIFEIKSRYLHHGKLQLLTSVRLGIYLSRIIIVPRCITIMEFSDTDCHISRSAMRCNRNTALPIQTRRTRRQRNITSSKPSGTPAKGAIIITLHYSVSESRGNQHRHGCNAPQSDAALSSALGLAQVAQEDLS